ncbi:hypothetical protein [Streptomyces sp. NPDC054838]
MLIDGEHYPPVTARAIETLRVRGANPVLALLIGGREKLGQRPLDVGIRVEHAADAEAGLAAALRRSGVRLVYDLSDEPVLDGARRCRLASIALWLNSAYVGADFRFDPPVRTEIVGAPSVAVYGTGKRVGKTAVTGRAAAVFGEAGLRPVLVSMGRGGPAHPEIIDGTRRPTAQDLLALAGDGRHAASDYIEGAVAAGVPAVGAWRAGGGMAGAPCFDNYALALDQAVRMNPGVLVLDSSGAAVPPAAADAGIFVVPATVSPADLYGYFGLYRTLLADLVVITMCEGAAGEHAADTVEEHLRSQHLTRPNVVRTVLRPRPLGELSGRRTWYATTAPQSMSEALACHLQQAHGAKLVGVSHALADRQQLRLDLADIGRSTEVVAVELKAAAVDVVTQFAVDHGLDVVYIDNEIRTTDGRPLDASLLTVADTARQRWTGRRGRPGPAG